MTLYDAGLDLLSLIGIPSYDPALNATNVNRRGLGTRDIAFVLQCLNGAIQECFVLGPIELREKRDALALRPPAGVTLTCTQFSQTISSLTTYASWMIGCTIRIAGDTRDNEITSQTTLLRPYMGTSQSGLSATVWCDAVALPSTVGAIIPPLEVPQYRPLNLVSNRSDYDARNQYGYSITKPVGIPDTAYVDTAYSSANSFTQKFLRVTPMPLAAHSLSYTAKMKPPTWIASHLYPGTSYSSDAGTVIPFDFVESTMLPIARQRMTSHPTFDNPALASELARQAEFSKRIFAEESKALITTQTAVYK